MDNHLGYEKSKRSLNLNYQNGTKSKHVRSSYGEFGIDDWQKRPLDDVYPIVFVDAAHFLVRSDNVIRKLAAYVILGINKDGCKEIISLQIGENESSKYWLGVFNELKNRGVKDIMVLCADGLTGIK